MRWQPVTGPQDARPYILGNAVCDLDVARLSRCADAGCPALPLAPRCGTTHVHRRVSNAQVTTPAHQDGDYFVDYEKVFEDVKAEAGQEAFVTFHTNNLKLFMTEGGKVYACRFALQALYGNGDPSLIPSITPIAPQDLLDCILLHKRGHAVILDTWTV